MALTALGKAFTSDGLSIKHTPAAAWGASMRQGTSLHGVRKEVEKPGPGWKMQTPNQGEIPWLM